MPKPTTLRERVLADEQREKRELQQPKHAAGCGCGQPGCPLEGITGRCFNCGNPCEADNGGAEVCSACYPAVVKVYNRDKRNQVDGPTWSPFNPASDGSWELQSVDENCNHNRSRDVAHGLERHVTPMEVTCDEDVVPYLQKQLAKARKPSDEQTRGMSLSFPPATWGDFAKEAREKGITVNVLIKQIMLKHHARKP